MASAAEAAESPAAAAASAPSYWCYRCGRVVRVREGETVECPRCRTGFVEQVRAPPPRPSAIARRRGGPIATMYMAVNPFAASAPSRDRRGADVGTSRRSRRGSASNRSPFNPVIVLRAPSNGGGDEADIGRPAATFDLYYDGGSGSGLRPLPSIMSEFLMGSGFTRLLEQLAHMESNGAPGGESDLPAASKAAVEAMPTVEIADGHLRLDAHCAVCTEPFEIGATAREMPCKHIFHEDCILPWLSQRNSCPVCRHEMPVDEQRAAAGGGDEDALGLTIWRLPGGGFAVGRFAGGRRAEEGRELPVVFTEVDGAPNGHGTPRRVSWSTGGGGGGSREGGGVGRAFRGFLSYVGRLFGASAAPSSPSSSGRSRRRRG